MNNLLQKSQLPPVVGFYFDKKRAIEKHASEIEILSLGSSHGQAAFNTSIIPNSFNLSIASQDMYQSFMLCKKYIDTLPNLKTVVLFFSVFSSGAEMQKTINAPLCQYYKNVFDIDFKYPWKEKYYGELIDYMKKNSPNISEDYMGWSPCVGVFNEVIAKRDVEAHVKHALRKNQQELYVREIYNLCHSRNVKLLVVIPPHSPNYHQYLAEICSKFSVSEKELFSPLYSIAEKDIQVLDHFSDVNFTNDDFWDWEHLAPNGSVKFSNILLKEIENENLRTYSS